MNSAIDMKSEMINLEDKDISFEGKMNETETNENIDVIENNVAELNEKEKYEAKIKDLTDTLLRLQAEFENYKKRVDSQRKDLIAEASRNILTELTPVLDNFELALRHSTNTSKEDMLVGFKMIHESLQSIMKDNGLEEINPKDHKFNPYEHEAVGCEECKGKAAHTVIEVLQTGYKINGKVIRHAKVKTAK